MNFSANLLSLALLVVVCSGMYHGFWKNWGPCDKSCGKGTQIRVKKCLFKGHLLDCGEKIASCNGVPCDDPSPNLIWGQCSEECGGGEKMGFFHDIQLAYTKCNYFPCQESYSCSGRNLLVAVDSTGSVGVPNWPASKQFAIDLALSADKMGVEKIAIIGYSVESVTVKSFFAPFSQQGLEDSVWSIPYDASSTYMDSAMMNILRNVNQLTMEQRENTTVVIMSDGPSMVNGGIDTLSVDIAQDIKDMGVHIIGIKIGSAVNNELPLLASLNSTGLPSIVEVGEHNMLHAAVAGVVDDFCRGA